MGLDVGKYFTYTPSKFKHSQSTVMPKPTLEYPSPTADAVKALRADAELTMKQCAEMIGYTLRMWQFWESGAYAMPGFVFAEFQAQLKRKGLLKKKRSKAK